MNKPTVEPDDPTPLQQMGQRMAPILSFVRTQLFSSLLLIAVTVVALFWANGDSAESYFGLFRSKVTLAFEDSAFTHTLQEWINDALMTLFFFLIGLEIKREMVTGQLRDRRAIALPAMAALGGMVLPGAFYAALNGGGPASHGWAVPMATDIAFALGVLGILGKRCPVQLRLFLLAVAILDDIASVLLIAIFYSKGLSWPWLAALAAIPFLLWLMRWVGIHKVYLYVPVGILAWVCALMSGVHPTIAGVIVGLMTPAIPLNGRPVLEELEHFLHPWVAFLVVPVFALANAGVSLDWTQLNDALNRQVTWGIAAGLLLGKCLGVSLFTWLALVLGMGKLPPGVSMRHIMAMSPLAGIGFTVGLMIATLSFENTPRLDAAKIGLLGASAAAAVLGAVALWFVTRPARPR